MTGSNVRTSKYKSRQRLLVLLLSFVMIATYMPTMAFAYEGTHTVIFNMNGYGGTAPNQQQVEHNGKITKPADPVDDAYIFNGWNTNADGQGETWDFEKPLGDGYNETFTLFAKWTPADEYVAKIGNTGYATLDAAFENAKDGETVTLLKDVSYPNNGTGLFNIKMSITLDGNGHSISGWGTRGGNKTTLAINNGGSNSVAVVLKNLTINNDASKGRPIETRGNIASITLDYVTVNATGGGNTQCLTVGGNQSSKATVTVTNSTINAGSGGYPVITFNPVKLNIYDSHIIGYCSVYFKQPDGSAGSFGSVLDADNTYFDAHNECDGWSNGFGAFVMCTDDIAINLNNCKINAEYTGTSIQTIFNEDSWIEEETESCAYTVTGSDTKIKGDIFDETYYYNYSTRVWNIQAGYYTENPTQYLANGFVAIELSSNISGADKTAFDEGYKYKVIPKDDAVARITKDEVTTYYATLAAALDDTKKTASADNQVTITVFGEAEGCVMNDCKYITIEGAESGKITGYMTSDAATSNLTGMQFKNLTFEKGGIILSNNVVSVAGMIIDNCSFDGTGANDAAIQINKKASVEMDGFRITNNVINNYTASDKSAIILNGSVPMEGSNVVIEGNKIDNINYNAIQALSFSNLVIKNNEIKNIGHNEKAINISGCNGTVITGNKIDLKSDQYAVGSVTGLAYLSNNTITQGMVVIDNIERNAKVSAGGAVAVDAYIVNGKIAGGVVIKNSSEAPSNELAEGISAAKIAETIYLAGIDATSNENLKLVKGKFIENPVVLVAEGYSVRASGDKLYPYEVYETETPQREVVTELTPETEVGDEVAEGEVETAQAVLDKVDVTGVAAALTEDGQSQLIKDAEKTNVDLPAAVVLAEQIDIDISVEVVAQKVYTITATEATEMVITFELKPYAIVTAIKEDGSTVSSEKVLVENDYLSKNNAQPITVVLGTTFEPQQVVHIHGNGEVEAYHSGDEVSYKNRTYVYTAPNEVASGNVTLEILDFSEIKLLAREMYANITFDSNGGSGSMESKAVEKGTEFTLPENGFTAPSGKEFKAWLVNEEEHAPGHEIIVEADTVVKAVWKDAPVNPVMPSDVSTGDSNGIVNYTLIGLMALMGIALALTLKKRFNR